MTCYDHPTMYVIGFKIKTTDFISLRQKNPFPLINLRKEFKSITSYEEFRDHVSHPLVKSIDTGIHNIKLINDGDDWYLGVSHFSTTLFCWQNSENPEKIPDTNISFLAEFKQKMNLSGTIGMHLIRLPNDQPDPDYNPEFDNIYDVLKLSDSDTE